MPNELKPCSFCGSKAHIFQKGVKNEYWHDFNYKYIANKRLCNKASKETRNVVVEMCKEVMQKCPEFYGLLVPMCTYHGNKCHEMFPCKRGQKNEGTV